MRRVAARDDAARTIATAEWDAADIVVRADDDGDGYTIEGLLIPYDQLSANPVREFGARERHRRGSWTGAIAARGSRPVPLIDEHYTGHPVGSLEVYEAEDGVRYRGRMLRSQRAEAAREAIAAGLLRPSAEFIHGRVQRVSDAVDVLSVRAIAAAALTYRPAFETTAAIRSEGEPVNCQHCGAELVPGVAHDCQTPATSIVPAPAARQDPPVTTVIDNDAIRRLAGEVADEAFRRHLANTPERPETGLEHLAGRSISDLMVAAAEDHTPDARAAGAPRAYLRDILAARALDDIVSTAGANAGVMTANTFGPVRRLVDRGRPAINAFGGPGPLPGTGLSFGYPYYDGTLTDLVGAQSAEKAEVTSGPMDIKRATATIATYAGAGDVSYQLIRRSDPSFLEAYISILLAAWNVVTDAAFVTALEAGSVTGDFGEALAAVDATELKNLFVDASVAVEAATGSPAEFILAGTNAFKAAAKLMNPLPVSNAAGTANARTLEVNVSGLPVIHDPNITTAKFIASNRSAARWHEDGPFQATAEDVAKLGRNVALWSMGAPAIYVPAGVIEIYDVTP